ncbi:DedA family protein [Thermocrispum municipale]|jgi:membrane protein DedA with SNARE-associated domain|uniref:DedA family protein n=1 Tax=Thermocrispum municipale TaxID=37926 RepID=UPI0004165092|nr:DedA family protein [Thermocrispum municipale]
MFELLDQFVTLLRTTVDSPWLWVLLFLITMLDAVIPFSPSETTVVTVAVLVSPHFELLLLAIAVSALGAFVGDCASHAMGRFAGPSLIARFSRGEKGRERIEWARAKVHQHAVLLLLVARYLPGGRFATGVATGGIRYPWRKFLTFDLIGTTIWASYSVLIGYVGGSYFADNPGKALLLAFAIALTTVGLIEVGRRIWARSHGKSADAEKTQPLEPEAAAQQGTCAP